MISYLRLGIKKYMIRVQMNAHMLKNALLNSFKRLHAYRLHIFTFMCQHSSHIMGTLPERKKKQPKKYGTIFQITHLHIGQKTRTFLYNKGYRPRMTQVTLKYTLVRLPSAWTAGRPPMTHFFSYSALFTLREQMTSLLSITCFSHLSTDQTHLELIYGHQLGVN